MFQRGDTVWMDVNWKEPAPAPAPIAVGDIVHVAGKVTDVTPNMLVAFPFMSYSVFISPDQIVHHEPAPPTLKVGDTVLSKDGNRGVIRYIENDWAVVLETEKRKTIRYLCDLQLVAVTI